MSKLAMKFIRRLTLLLALTASLPVILADAQRAMAEDAQKAVVPDARWLSFDYLVPTDRSLAETVFAEMFGPTPELWPDWAEADAVRISAGRDKDLLIVRQPLRAPCGAYGFTVFGPVEQGTRAKLGERFCAGDLEIVPLTLQSMPDLRFSGEGVQDAEGNWQSQTIRWRWVGNGWGQVIISSNTKGAP